MMLLAQTCIGIMFCASALATDPAPGELSSRQPSVLTEVRSFTACMCHLASCSCSRTCIAYLHHIIQHLNTVGERSPQTQQIASAHTATSQHPARRSSLSASNTCLLIRRSDSSQVPVLVTLATAPLALLHPLPSAPPAACISQPMPPLLLPAGSTSSLHHPSCDKGCPSLFAPVCGDDGVTTFANVCVAACQGVVASTSGACKGENWGLRG